MKAVQPQGMCQFCGAIFTKNAASRHYPKCDALHAAMEKQRKKKAEQETLFYLRVEPAFRGPYWLDLEIRASSSLGTLDSYLRAIWLECCDHLSAFMIGSERGEEVGKAQKAENIFDLSPRLIHIYDFGTSSITRIKCAGYRSGQPLNGRPIALLARNLPPPLPCDECGELASWICNQCTAEAAQEIWLCDAHAGDHECDQDYLYPVVNSPRVGMCGYSGPAKAPY